MALRVFNTLTRRKEEFAPLSPPKVGVYLCGPTVYSYSHVGHMVGPVIFDMVKRWLTYNGYQVTFVVNVTDIDDKIINESKKTSESIPEIVKRVTDDYYRSLKLMGVSVDQFPHATQHIDGILKVIGGLIDKGYAYAVGGDVYFDVAKDDDYGKLSNRKVDELLAGTRKEVGDLKRSPADFALWKAAKPGEPAWESPWGPGRPGWHIECSAMSTAILGETFDIHGGGLDLVFPHHEDEIAQSESYTGKPFAKYWMHNGLMQRRGETEKLKLTEGDMDAQEASKMGKSKNNAVVMHALLERYSPELLRYFLVSTHYRSPIDFGDDRLKEAASALGRLQGLRDRIERILKKPFTSLPAPEKRGSLAFEAATPFLKEVTDLRNRFLEHMDDDFNSGAAVGVLFELAPIINRFADAGNLDSPESYQSSSASLDEVRTEFFHAATVLRELTRILGILESSEGPKTGGDEMVGKLIELLIDLRATARQQKNFALSDTVRNKLKELGVVLEDGPSGTRWKIGSVG
jgi:cysteinyl-tRNA synthetase